MKSAILLQLSVGLGVCMHAQALELSRFLSQEAIPAGVEQSSMGTSIDSSSGVENARALIASVNAAPVKISRGQGVVTLKLSKRTHVRHLAFLNEGAEGRLVAYASADNLTWVPMGAVDFASGDDVVDLNAGASFSKYVRLAFELSKPGSISGLKVTGEDYDADYQVTQSGGGSMQEFNFATGIGGGRLIYASAMMSGKASDSWKNGILRFDASKASEFVAVYDLGQERELGKFGCSHGAGLASMSVYTLGSISEKENWRGRLAYDTAALDLLQPVVVVQPEKGGRGSQVAELKAPVTARFVAFKWKVVPGLTNFPVYGAVIGGQASVLRSPAVRLASMGQGAAEVRQGSRGVVSADKPVSFDTPAVFAWDLERGIFNSGRQSSFLRSDGFGTSGSSVYSRMTRKADEVVNPEDVDPVSVEILRCDIVSP